MNPALIAGLLWSAIQNKATNTKQETIIVSIILGISTIGLITLLIILIKS